MSAYADFLLDRCYGGPVTERLRLATALHSRYGEILRQREDIQEELVRLARAATALSAHMAAMGMDALCAACAARPGGGCCSAEMAANCDTPLLLINLLLGLALHCQDSGPESCRFLGESGCIFPIKPVFCLNYNCSHILKKAGKEELAALYRHAGRTLSLQNRLEGLLLDFLKGNEATACAPLLQTR